MELAIFVLFVVFALANSADKKQKKRKADKNGYSPFEQAEQMELPVEQSYAPYSAEGASGGKADPDRQRRLKEELRRKHGGKPAAERSYQGGGWEGRSRTVTAVSGSYSDEYLGSMLYDSSEGEGNMARDYRLEELTPKSDDHVVRAFTESLHSHVESSMTGLRDCPGDTDIHRDSYAIMEREGAAVPELNPGTLRTAILHSEILGRPRALRRGR